MRENLNSLEYDVNDLKNSLRNGTGNLIDVREYAEFAGGHVKGAKLIPGGDIEKRYAEIDRDQPVFLMCRSGMRSAEAQRKLLALGFSDVRNVRGGFEAWKKAEYEFVKEADAVWSLERQVRFVAGSLVVLGVVLSLLIHPYFIALSAFVGAGLVFAAVTDTCTMGLILAKMPWNKSSGAVGKTATQKL